jgi:CHAT domain-containing protein
MSSRIWSILVGFGFLWSAMPQVPATAQFSIGPGFGGNRPGSGSNNSGSDYPNRGNDYPSRPSSPSILDWDPFRAPTPRRKQLSEREQFEKQFLDAIDSSNESEAVRLFEEYQVQQFNRYLKFSTDRSALSATQISLQLGRLAQETGQRAAVLYGVALKDQTQMLLVMPSITSAVRPGAPKVASLKLSRGLLAQSNQTPVVRKAFTDLPQEKIIKVGQSFRRAISDPTQLDQPVDHSAAQQLHQWTVAPLEEQLRQQNIDTILFSMDDGLRSLPYAALHNGQQYLAEQFRVALIPSFTLTNTNRSLALSQQRLLAMGISKEVDGLAPLPAVPIELATITKQLWQGPSQETLDENSTLDQIKAQYQQQRFSILHLASHAEFRPGDVENSYVQLWDNKLTLPKVRELSRDLKWQDMPSLDLLVLSACQTALGSKEAELGFAGTALNAGAQTAIASLWAVNDRGSLGLMSGLYQGLRNGLSRSEAMRQAQLMMLRGDTRLQGGQLYLANQGAIAAPLTDQRFQHPYFWAGYTVVGNWH